MDDMTKAIGITVVIGLCFTLAFGLAGGLMQTAAESFPSFTVSGEVASCVYSWLDDSTTVTFSGQEPIRFVGQFNLKIGIPYTITYKNMPPRGNHVINLTMP